MEALSLGAVSRLRPDTSDELELTFPAYAALATWNREGLDLIVKIAGLMAIPLRASQQPSHYSPCWRPRDGFQLAGR